MTTASYIEDPRRRPYWLTAIGGREGRRLLAQRTRGLRLGLEGQG